MEIKRGYCYLVDMNPPRKSKPGKIRPVVVLQGDDITAAGSPGVTVLACSSQCKPENALRVHLTSQPSLKLSKPTDVLVDQLHTVDQALFIEELGPVTGEDLSKIINGVEFLLEL